MTTNHTLIEVVQGTSITAFFLLHLRIISIAWTVLFTIFCNTFILLPWAKSKHYTVSFTIGSTVIELIITVFFLLHIRIVYLVWTILFITLYITFILPPQTKSKLMTVSYTFINVVLGISITAYILLHSRVISLPWLALFTTLCIIFFSYPPAKLKHHTVSFTLSNTVLGSSGACWPVCVFVREHGLCMEHYKENGLDVHRIEAANMKNTLSSDHPEYPKMSTLDVLGN